MFTKTEALRRVRMAARDAKRREGLPHNAKAEIGYRTHPVALPEFPTSTHEAFHDHDDLREFSYTLTTKDMHDEVRAHGAVVHIYLSTTGDWGQLVNTVTVWLGTPDQPPRWVSFPGKGWMFSEEVEG